MIKNFKSEEARRIFDGEYSRKLPTNIQSIIMRKLWMMDAALNLNDLRIPPANCLKMLKGNRRGQYSIRVNDQWRVCFLWQDGNVFDLDIVDYHK